MLRSVLTFFLVSLLFATLTVNDRAAGSERPTLISEPSSSLKHLTAEFLLYTAFQHFDFFQSLAEPRFQTFGEKILSTVFQVLKGEALLANAASKDVRLESWPEKQTKKGRPALVVGPYFILEALSNPLATGGLFIKQIYTLSAILEPSKKPSSLEAVEEPLVAEAIFYREAPKNFAFSLGKATSRIRRVLEAFEDFPAGPKWVLFVTLETRRDYALQRSFAERTKDSEDLSAETLLSAFRSLIANETNQAIERGQKLITQWRDSSSRERLSWANEQDWKFNLIRLDGLLSLSEQIESLVEPRIKPSDPFFREIQSVIKRLQGLRHRLSKETELLQLLTYQPKDEIPLVPELIRKNAEIFYRWVHESQGSSAEAEAVFPVSFAF